MNWTLAALACLLLVGACTADWGERDYGYGAASEEFGYGAGASSNDDYSYESASGKYLPSLFSFI